MSFTKLDDGLIFSSILAEDDAVFKVWVLILSRTEKDGIARISPAFLASVCRKDDAEVERCLRVLESPDPRSRSLNDDGRRIERVDGGFYVINYGKYRERADAEDVREYERERKRRQRSVPPVSGTEAGRSASSSASTSTEGVQGEPPPARSEELSEAESCRRTIERHTALSGRLVDDLLWEFSEYKGRRLVRLDTAPLKWLKVTHDRILADLMRLEHEQAGREAPRGELPLERIKRIEREAAAANLKRLDLTAKGHA